MDNYWVVLSGSKNDHIFDRVEELSCVGIGWPSVGNLTGLNLSDIRQVVDEQYPDSSVGHVAGYLDRFVNLVQPGHTVLTFLPAPHGQRVLIGTIEGDYRFDPSPEHGLLSHTRQVRWIRTDLTFGIYNRTFQADGKTPPYGRHPVWNAGQHAEQITALLEHDDVGDAEYKGDDEDLDAGGFKFGLEAQLQEALSDNMQDLEQGLTLDETEKSVPAGRIDIAATDTQGGIVIIELKAGTAKSDSITQLLSYMGTVDNPDDREVRGILVAYDFDPKVRYAANALPNVTLKAYRFRFDFTDI
ncbi:MAG: endonuclease NucS [Chloroflexota bacterium]|nr:endonuclease NucS [Chloroflexota bacterium]MDE2883567.1 endonuclease NucS [Chloroflexota bacterium]